MGGGVYALYSRELEDVPQSRALGVARLVPSGCGPETAMRELVGWACPPETSAVVSCIPLVGVQTPEPDPASALRLLLPSVWSLGRLYPLTRSPVMSTVVFYRSG